MKRLLIQQQNKIQSPTSVTEFLCCYPVWGVWGLPQASSDVRVGPRYQLSPFQLQKYLIVCTGILFDKSGLNLPGYNWVNLMYSRPGLGLAKKISKIRIWILRKLFYSKKKLHDEKENFEEYSYWLNWLFYFN
jgi:hypothetical protein